VTILFAPSEGKRPGGDLPPIAEDAFCLPELYPRRVEAARRYVDFVRKADDSIIVKLFGVKEAALLARWRADLFTTPSMKAVLRYDGVAYDHLDYPALGDSAQRYVDENLIIFSNLFGPVSAKDRLPDYKLKQGESIGDFAPEKFYKTHFSDALTAYLETRGPVVDLRAGFYEKFYKIPLPHLTMKFLKNGRSVSHWAKAYRGLVVRRMAEEGIESEEALMAMDVEGLALKEIVEGRRKKEIVYEIVS
jgi:cytoplasmic iron level regulating protein YaaA (DUF328/UPF0246 family)